MRASLALQVMLLAPLLSAQPLSAQPTATIEAGYRQMYNLQFDAAHATFQAWMVEHPDDPLGPVSNAAAYLFTELDRMHILESEFFTNDDKFTGKRPDPDPRLKAQFDQALSKSAQLDTQVLARDPMNADALFARVLRYGLRADYLSLVEESHVAALNETKRGRDIAERLLMLRPDYHDAHLAIGVENYLLSLKPAPLRWLLRVAGAQTDRDKGVSLLRITAQDGRFLRPFAKLLLAVAALRADDPTTAKSHLEWLVREFPLNRLYRSELEKLRN